jgi:hypothetical protein
MDQLHPPRTAWTDVCVLCHPQIVSRIHLPVTPYVHTPQVHIDCVTPNDSIDYLYHVVIGQDATFQTDWTGKPHRGSCHGLNRHRVSHLQRLTTRSATNLGLIRFVISPNKTSQGFAVG